MGSPRRFERISFRDTRFGVPKSKMVTVRDITFATKRDRKVAIARAAAAAWPAAVLTVDHDGQQVFAGAEFAPVGEYRTWSIDAEEAHL